jgi:ferritin
MDKKMLDALNDQMREEISSAYIYFAIAADMESQNWKGVSAWFKTQAKEELGHGMKLYGYINGRGEKAIVPALEKPQESWGTILDAFEGALKHEKYISGCIHKLVKLAKEVDDLPTENFLQWFVSEQVEEEAAPEEIIQMLKKVGDSNQMLFMIDRQLGSREG